MNLRRLILTTYFGKDRNGSNTDSGRASDVRFGSKADMCAASRCPLLLRKRTFAAQIPMSAMGQERTSRHLFDDLVRSTDERIGEVKAELLGCPEIDD